MKKTSLTHVPAELAQCFDVLGDWWGLLIARDLLLGMKRFSDLQLSLGIARNILSRRLRALEKHGLVTRTLYCSTPPRYEYHLTERGRELVLVLMALAQVGERLNTALANEATEAGAREGCPALSAHFSFRDRVTGAPVRAVITDAATGRPVNFRDVTLTDEARHQSVTAERALDLVATG